MLLDVSNEQLYILLTQGNDFAYQELYGRCQSLFIKFSKEAFSTYFTKSNSNVENLELVFVETIGKVIEFYRLDIMGFTTYFFKYYYKIIRNWLINNNRRHDKCLSLNTITEGGDEFIECVPDQQEPNPSEYYNGSINSLSLCSPSKRKMDKRSKQIEKLIKYRIEGYGYSDIAKMLGVSLSTVKRIALSVKNNRKMRDIKLFTK